MALPEFVYRRGNILHYRRAWPRELQAVLGKAAFAMSLRTSDAREALKARPEAERRYHERVDQGRLELARRAASPPLTVPAAEAIALAWFREGLATAEDYLTIADHQAAMKAAEDARWAAGEGRRALGENDLRHREKLAERLRNGAGFASDPEADAHLLRLLGRASVAADEVIAERARGRYGARPKDPLFAAAIEAPAVGVPPVPAAQKPAPEHTVADLEQSFRKARFPRLASASQQGYVPVFRVLRELVGEDRSLAGLTHEDGVGLFEAIQEIPINAQKNARLKGLSLREQIAEGKRLGLPTLSPKTINERYLGNLGALFRLAQQRGWMQLNPVQGLRAKAVVAAGDARDAFGAQLKAVFGTSPWQPIDRSGSGRPIRFWGPLLALYHGLRLGEVAGLQVQDVAEENGQAMLLIRSGKRQLKTEAARRDIPLHPELERLGFLEFVTDRRAKEKADAMLFAGEKAVARDQWGRSLGTWFAKHVRGLKLEGRKLTFHSLRHDFKDALREAEVSADLADYIMGHARPGVGAIYGGRPSLGRLKGAVKAVQFPGLELPS